MTVCLPAINQNESYRFSKPSSKSCQMTQQPPLFFFKIIFFKLYFKVVFIILKLCIGFNISLEKSELGNWLKVQSH